jgi:hypothetical protein
MRNLNPLYIGVIGSMAIGLIFTVGYIEQNKIYLHIALKEHANDLHLLLQYQPDNALFQQDLNNTQTQINDLEHNKDESSLFKMIGFFGAIMIVVYLVLPILPIKPKESKT